MNPALLLSSALVATVAVAQNPAQEAQPKETPGGGSLHLGEAPYTFTFESLNLAPAQPKLKLPRVFVLRGRLEPVSGPSVAFELTAMEDGRIYALRLVRKHPKPAEEDHWSPTPKTKVEVLSLEARPGGKLRISLSGALASSLGGKAGAASWKGELWGTFREVPL